MPVTLTLDLTLLINLNPKLGNAFSLVILLTVKGICVLILIQIGFTLPDTCFLISQNFLVSYLLHLVLLLLITLFLQPSYQISSFSILPTNLPCLVLIHLLFLNPILLLCLILILYYLHLPHYLLPWLLLYLLHYLIPYLILY